MSTDSMEKYIYIISIVFVTIIFMTTIKETKVSVLLAEY